VMLQQELALYRAASADLRYLATSIDDSLSPSFSVSLPVCVCPFIICAPTPFASLALAAGKSVVQRLNVTSSLSSVPSRFPVHCNRFTHRNMRPPSARGTVSTVQQYRLYRCVVKVVRLVTCHRIHHIV
jgi:hypothetical protein